MVWVWIPLCVMFVWAGILLWFRRFLYAEWVEPGLRHPVVIIESDDWGPSDASDAEALDRLAAQLRGFKDSDGRCPVMTLGVVLAVPDSDAMRKDMLEYRYVTLADSRLGPIREAMQSGIKLGVFSLQLHGKEHFWPPTIMGAARDDSTIREWLTSGNFPDAQRLPPRLQSRWIDAEKLPSRDHPAPEVEHAAEEEVALFSRVFGYPPDVVVPPTFIWTEAAELAWGRSGIGTIVTPGRFLDHRDENGTPQGNDMLVRNGQAAAGGMTYLVRDIYFEPALGHQAEEALMALKQHWSLGRPGLLETHRFNFVGDPESAAAAEKELVCLLSLAQEQLPDVRFLSTAELGKAYRCRDEGLFDNRISIHIDRWIRRLARHVRLRKLAWLSGLALLAWLLKVAAGYAATCSMSSRRQIAVV